MKIRRSPIDGSWYIVFEHSFAADKWQWLFWNILRRQRVCFGDYDNAYLLL